MAKQRRSRRDGVNPARRGALVVLATIALTAVVGLGAWAQTPVDPLDQFEILGVRSERPAELLFAGPPRKLMQPLTDDDVAITVDGEPVPARLQRLTAADLDLAIVVDTTMTTDELRVVQGAIVQLAIELPQGATMLIADASGTVGPPTPVPGPAIARIRQLTGDAPGDALQRAVGRSLDALDAGAGDRSALLVIGRDLQRRLAMIQGQPFERPVFLVEVGAADAPNALLGPDTTGLATAVGVDDILATTDDLSLDVRNLYLATVELPEGDPGAITLEIPAADGPSPVRTVTLDPDTVRPAEVGPPADATDGGDGTAPASSDATILPIIAAVVVGVAALVLALVGARRVYVQRFRLRRSTRRRLSALGPPPAPTLEEPADQTTPAATAPAPGATSDAARPAHGGPHDAPRSTDAPVLGADDAAEDVAAAAGGGDPHDGGPATAGVPAPAPSFAAPSPAAPGDDAAPPTWADTPDAIPADDDAGPPEVVTAFRRPGDTAPRPHTRSAPAGRPIAKLSPRTREALAHAHLGLRRLALASRSAADRVPDELFRLSEARASVALSRHDISLREIVTGALDDADDADVALVRRTASALSTGWEHTASQTSAPTPVLEINAVLTGRDPSRPGRGPQRPVAPVRALNPLVEIGLEHVVLATHPSRDSELVARAVTAVDVMRTARLARPALEISPQLLAERGRYRAALDAGLDDAHQRDRWLELLCECIAQGATESAGRLTKLGRIRNRYRKRTTDARSLPLVDLVLAQPIVDVALTARRLSVDEDDADDLLSAASRAGWLRRDDARPATWVADDVLALFENDAQTRERASQPA